MSRARAAAMACAVAIAATAGDAASGSTVEVTRGDKIRYVAAVGERNAPSIAGIPDTWPSAFLVRDPGANMTPGRGCLAVDALRVGCVAFGGAMYEVRLDLRDNDDTLQVEGDPIVNANGGPGDDTLVGGGWDDDFDGGGGRDELRGSEGDDELTDGDRDDGGGAPRDADVLEGGPGDDTISYEQRTRAVHVDLEATVGGAPGENDTLTSFEHVRGGAGDDRLVGDNVGNRIDGGGGADRLVGRGGDDWMRRAGAAHVTCGGGHDYVQHVTVKSVLRADCETVIRALGDSSQFTVDAVPRRRGDALALELSCPENEGGEAPCTGTVRLRSAGQRGATLAEGSIPARNGELTIRLAITAAGRRVLAKRRPRPVVVAFAARRTAGLAWTVRFPRGGVPR
jgi:hypothetical protein